MNVRTKFTASEVRAASRTFGLGTMYEMLHAYADRLEADEKAQPVCWAKEHNRETLVSWSKEPPEFGKGGWEPLYTHPDPADSDSPCMAIGSWLSAALDDPKVCVEMKADINKWFDAGSPQIVFPPEAPADAERLAEALRKTADRIYENTSPDDVERLAIADMIVRHLRLPKDEYPCAYEDEAQPHDLIKTGDPDAAPSICDTNGEVVLAYCRKCRQGEGDLAEFCPAQPPAASVQDAISIAADISTRPEFSSYEMTDLDTLRPEVREPLDRLEYFLTGTHNHNDLYTIRAELRRLANEELALSNLVQRQAKILTGVANALKGEPGRLHMHSHHDLAEVAHSTTAELAALKARIADAPEWYDHPDCVGISASGVMVGLHGKRVRLLVDEPRPAPEPGSLDELRIERGGSSHG